MAPSFILFFRGFLYFFLILIFIFICFLDKQLKTLLLTQFEGSLCEVKHIIPEISVLRIFQKFINERHKFSPMFCHKAIFSRIVVKSELVLSLSFINF